MAHPDALPGQDTSPFVGTSLDSVLAAGVRVAPSATAIKEADGTAITYADLTGLAGRVASLMEGLGIARGDRVAVCLPKSIDAIAAILGILRAGAAYVPVDPDSPPGRASLIMSDCGVRCIVGAPGLLDRLGSTVDEHLSEVPVVKVERPGGGHGLSAALDSGPSGTAPPRPTGPEELAYILYTSGSTGRPKGVMLSHRNALSFLGWCSRIFRPMTSDRFSSHAPLHFDLSVLDLFLPLGHGATLQLIDADDGRNPLRLAERIEEYGITSWYSAPSILAMLAQFGRLERRDLSALRRILFAGEVFAVKHLRAVKERIPHADYYNLYGPTETNVCTWYRIPDHIPLERTSPFPIGRACDHFRSRVVDASGADVPSGGEGELCMAGDGVMLGYWGRQGETELSFRIDDDGTRWYRTGDVVRDESGEYLFLGRRDRMVKRRGYRIELSEIEAGIYRHPDVQEVAAVSIPDGDGAVRIRVAAAFGKRAPPTVVELKGFCAEVLPIYMVPDEFVFYDSLPKTSTDKVDLRRIAERA